MSKIMLWPQIQVHTVNITEKNITYPLTRPLTRPLTGLFSVVCRGSFTYAHGFCNRV